MLSRPKIQLESRPQINLNTSQVPEMKRILYWTPYFMAEDWQFGFGSKPFSKCPQPNCAGDNVSYETWIDSETKVTSETSETSDPANKDS